MKRVFRSNYLLFLVLGILLVPFLLSAQVHFYQGPDAERESPTDSVIGQIEGVDILIDYSQPFVKGRKIWGGIVPYGKIWRTGANEATVFVVSKDVKINGQDLPKGRYALFTIPTEGEWTIIFNKRWNQWGASKYKEKKDQLRIKVKPTNLSQLQEQLTFFIEGNRVLFRWEYLELGFTVTR